jgi:hypothetical protein
LRYVPPLSRLTDLDAFTEHHRCGIWTTASRAGRLDRVRVRGQLDLVATFCGGRAAAISDKSWTLQISPGLQRLLRQQKALAERKFAHDDRRGEVEAITTSLAFNPRTASGDNSGGIALSTKPYEAKRGRVNVSVAIENCYRSEPRMRAIVWAFAASPATRARSAAS